MNLLIISFIVGIVILISFNVTDDAFGSFRESRGALNVNQVNEYSNYIHFQPEWNSYPRNLIVDVSTTWDREIIVGDVEASDILKHGAKQKQNGLQYVNNKPVVAVQYDYRDCESQWFHYAKTGLDFFRNQIGLFEKESIPNPVYSNEEQTEKLRSGFGQFVPICTSKDTTDFDYTVSINDSAIGFDVYFVPSEMQQSNYFSNTENFEYYAEGGCYANNFQKISGTCKNIDKNGGLLIVIPDELSRPMTKISVELTEK